MSAQPAPGRDWLEAALTRAGLHQEATEVRRRALSDARLATPLTPSETTLEAVRRDAILRGFLEAVSKARLDPHGNGFARVIMDSDVHYAGRLLREAAEAEGCNDYNTTA